MTTSTSQPRRIYPDIDQVLLRLLVVLGASITVVAAQAAGARPPVWLQVVVGGLAVLATLRPESVAATGLLLATAYAWALAPETLSPLVLLAAAGMVLTHVAALVAAQGPAQLRVDAVQVRRWAARGVLLWLAATATWGLGVVIEDVPQRRFAYALGLTLLAVLAVATTQTLTRALSTSQRPAYRTRQRRPNRSDS
jgi:hypothetical protein